MTQWHPLTPTNSLSLLSEWLSLLAVPALSLSFPLNFLLHIANHPLSSLNSTIYSLRLVGVSWLHSGLTRVGGVQCDYSWNEIYPIGNGGSGIGTDFYLQKIARQRYSPRQYEPLGRYVVLSKRTPEQITNGWTWVCLSRTRKWYELTMRFGLNFGS